MAGASGIVKFIANFGVSAAKRKYGTSKKSGVGQLTDEQLGQGLNKFQAKKAEEKAVKASAKDKPKDKPESPPRDVKKSATQKGVRFSDKPQIDDAVESDAARSVDETNMVRGSSRAGKSTNESGKTNIGSKSIANFIQDQKNASPGMKARDKENKAYAAYIKAAPNKTEKAKRQAEFDDIKNKRTKTDKKAEANRRTNISRGSRGKPKKKRTDYVTQDGVIVGKPTKEQVNASMRNAEARNDSTAAARMRKYLKELSDRDAGRGQVESAGPRMIDTSDRMIQDAKQSLIAVFGQKKGTQLFNEKLSGAKTKPQFLVDIRSMVKGQSKGQKGTRASETGAVVGQRKSNLQLVDRSSKKQPKRKEATSRRGKSGNSEVDAPGMMRGGMPRKRMGSMDYRKGGMVKASYNNKRGK
jgi:hypothetical protein